MLSNLYDIMDHFSLQLGFVINAEGEEDDRECENKN